MFDYLFQRVLLLLVEHNMYPLYNFFGKTLISICEIPPAAVGNHIVADYYILQRV